MFRKRFGIAFSCKGWARHHHWYATAAGRDQAFAIHAKLWSLNGYRITPIER